MMTTERFDTVLSTLPRVRQALNESHDHAHRCVDDQLLAMCQDRIAELLGASSSGATHSLAETAFGQAAIAFVEQWVIDVANMTDDMVAALVTEMGEDALLDFVHGVLVVEQRIRLDLAWQQLGIGA